MCLIKFTWKELHEKFPWRFKWNSYEIRARHNFLWIFIEFEEQPSSSNKHPHLIMKPQSSCFYKQENLKYSIPANIYNPHIFGFQKFKQLYSFNNLTVEAFFLSIQLEQSRTGSNIAYCDTLVEIVSNKSLYAWFISKTYFFTPKRCFWSSIYYCECIHLHLCFPLNTYY